jgi:glutathione synthase
MQPRLEMNMKTFTKFLFVMDPYEALNLETETSLLLMQELISRGHGVYWLQQEDLALVHSQPMGLVFPVTGAEPLQRAEPVWSNLNDFDAVLVRKDPPFDTEYLQLTLILDHLCCPVQRCESAQGFQREDVAIALAGFHAAYSGQHER